VGTKRGKQRYCAGLEIPQNMPAMRCSTRARRPRCFRQL